MGTTIAKTGCTAASTATICAYADDTASVVENLDDDLPIFNEIFDEYRRLSGLNP